MSPLPLPTELIIAIATQLDAKSLVRFKSVRASTLPSLYFPCLTGPFRALTLISDLQGLPRHRQSNIFFAIRPRPRPRRARSMRRSAQSRHRAEPARAGRNVRGEAWRTFSWSEHLTTLEAPLLRTEPRTSLAGLSCCLSARSWGRSQVFRRPVRSVAPCVGFQGRHWRIDFDYSIVVLCFVIDATQDLVGCRAKARYHDVRALVLPLVLYIPTSLTMRRACVRVVHWSVTHTLGQWGSPSFWKLPDALQRVIANTRYPATFSA